MTNLLFLFTERYKTMDNGLLNYFFGLSAFDYEIDKLIISH